MFPLPQTNKTFWLIKFLTNILYSLIKKKKRKYTQKREREKKYIYIYMYLNYNLFVQVNINFTLKFTKNSVTKNFFKN
jgi:hypothetical protein